MRFLISFLNCSVQDLVFCLLIFPSNCQTCFSEALAKVQSCIRLFSSLLDLTVTQSVDGALIVPSFLEWLLHQWCDQASSFAWLGFSSIYRAFEVSLASYFGGELKFSRRICERFWRMIRNDTRSQFDIIRRQRVCLNLTMPSLDCHLEIMLKGTSQHVRVSLANLGHQGINLEGKTGCSVLEQTQLMNGSVQVDKPLLILEMMVSQE